MAPLSKLIDTDLVAFQAAGFSAQNIYGERPRSPAQAAEPTIPAQKTDNVDISANGRAESHLASCASCQDALAARPILPLTATQANASPDSVKINGNGVNGARKTDAKDDEHLSEEQLADLLELRATDASVKAHEASHLAAAGGLARSGASFKYTRGPDGNQYAVAGEVSIDSSEGSTPRETIQKARRIRAAALAPANPSPQDRAVAANASAMATRATAELAKEDREKLEELQAAQNGDSSNPLEAENDSRLKAAIRAYSTTDSSTRLTPQFDDILSNIFA